MSNKKGCSKLNDALVGDVTIGLIWSTFLWTFLFFLHFPSFEMKWKKSIAL